MRRARAHGARRGTVLQLPDTSISDLRPADVFSFGMTVVAVSTRSIPFAALNPMQLGMQVPDERSN